MCYGSDFSVYIFILFSHGLKCHTFIGLTMKSDYLLYLYVSLVIKKNTCRMQDYSMTCPIVQFRELLFFIKNFGKGI